MVWWVNHNCGYTSSTLYFSQFSICLLLSLFLGKVSFDVKVLVCSSCFSQLCYCWDNSSQVDLDARVNNFVILIPYDWEGSRGAWLLLQLFTQHNTLSETISAVDRASLRVAVFCIFKRHMIRAMFKKYSIIRMPDVELRPVKALFPLGLAFAGR